MRVFFFNEQKMSLGFGAFMLSGEDQFFIRY